MGTGAPIEESLKRAVIAARLGRAAGAAEPDVGNAMYASLLQHLGCTAYAHQAADVWGDDVATTRLAFLTDFADPRDIWRTWVAGVADATGRSRARVLATTLTQGRKVDAEGPASTCDVAQGACRQLGLPEPVQRSLSEIFAMWNGEGYPAVRGIDISLSTRLLHVASTAVLFATTPVSIPQCGRCGDGRADISIRIWQSFSQVKPMGSWPTSMRWTRIKWFSTASPARCV